MSNAKRKRIVEIIVASLLVVVFVVAVVYFNVIYHETEVEGYEIGDKCPDFELLAYKTAGNQLDTFSSESARGQVLVINFWFVNCGGCKKELPYFDNVQKKYGDDVKIIVVHDYAQDEEYDKQEYLDKNGYGDFSLTFLQDTEELYLYKKLGGDGNFPMTVVLDKEGIIRMVTKSSMTEDKLSAEVEKWL